MKTNLWKSLGILKTLYYNYKFLGCSFSKNRIILCYRHSFFEFDNKSKIILFPGASLSINKSWTNKVPFASHFTFGPESKLIISGKFAFYYNGKLGLGPSAIFECGSGFINSDFTITCISMIKIGNNVIIGPNCVLRDSDGHEIYPSNKPSTLPIYIEDDVWIGCNVTILKGVTIGHGSVVAAGSVVTTSIPAGVLAGGNPCRVIRPNIIWK
jgi:acetyltransferase-like isoleucine patch superfamily enzyme